VTGNIEFGTYGKLSVSGARVYIENTANDHVVLRANSANVLYARSDGKVGIGSLTPGSLLGVNGSVSVGASYDTVAAPTNGMIIEGNVGIGTTTVNSRFVVEGGGGNILDLYDSIGAAKVTVLNNGNVGIGTTGPSQKLEVAGNIRTDQLHTDVIRNEGNTVDLIRRVGATSVTFNSGGSETFIFKPGGSEAMRILTSGNVGIGNQVTN
jgi:hypothetical protein